MLFCFGIGDYTLQQKTDFIGLIRVVHWNHLEFNLRLLSPLTLCLTHGMLWFGMNPNQNMCMLSDREPNHPYTVHISSKWKRNKMLFLLFSYLCVKHGKTRIIFNSNGNILDVKCVKERERERKNIIYTQNVFGLRFHTRKFL